MTERRSCGASARAHHRWWAGLALSPVVTLAGCVDNLAICTDGGSGTVVVVASQAAIVVQVRDATTGTPLAAGARGTIQDGEYVDSLRVQTTDASGQPLTLGAGRGRPGTYSVTVVHQGYQTWQQNSVVVALGSCGLAAQVLHADLQPLP